MIGSKQGEANAEQCIRFADLHDLGCVACRLQGLGWVPPEKDHRNVGDLAGMPRTAGGHDNTIPLCQWHHRGIRFEGYGSEAAHLKFFGPSKHLHKKQFIEKYGTIEQLHEVVRKLLERHRATTRLRPQNRCEPA